METREPDETAERGRLNVPAPRRLMSLHRLVPSRPRVLLLSPPVPPSPFVHVVS